MAACTAGPEAGSSHSLDNKEVEGQLERRGGASKHGKNGAQGRDGWWEDATVHASV